jgi:hypothetical protein
VYTKVDGRRRVKPQGSIVMRATIECFPSPGGAITAVQCGVSAAPLPGLFLHTSTGVCPSNPLRRVKQNISF